MRRRRPFAVVLVLAAVAAVGTGCQDDGRALEPAPEVPISPETTSTTAAPDPGFTTDGPVDGGFALTSPSFATGGFLDQDFTCDGLNVSPALTISGVPDGTVELALTVVDRDASGYVHWVVAGIDPSTTRVEAGVAPPGSVAATTTGGVPGWEGPCPPDGDAPHEYVFTVHAATQPIGLQAGLAADDALERIEGASTRSALTVALYAAQP